MNRWDGVALLLCLLAFGAAVFVAQGVFEGIPHIEDEMTYVWQARLAAEGKLSLPALENPESFFSPFVIDYHGARFGKYPPGWPAALSLGMRLGLRTYVNPFLFGLSLWLVYRLGKRLLDEKTALLAVFLMAGSPFCLMNAASLLSHIWALFLTLAFTLGWVDCFDPAGRVDRRLSAALAVFSLGALVLTRPLTAVGVGLPFIVQGIFFLLCGSPALLRRALGIALGVGLFGCLYFVWQAALTGDAFLNPYTLWWSYDRIGFGEGIGVQAGGFTPYAAWLNTYSSLWFGMQDFFGFPYLSFAFLPFGVFAIRQKRAAWTSALIFPALVLVYSFYWIGFSVLGPRYYMEGFFSFALLSAAGMRWLLGCLPSRPLFSAQKRFQTLRFALVSLLLVLLFCGNLFFYTPARLLGLHGLYGIERAQLLPFLQPEAARLAPAVVVVHPQDDWLEYGVFLELEDPSLTTPFVFVRALTPEQDARAVALFPGRRVIHYYPKSRFFINP